MNAAICGTFKRASCKQERGQHLLSHSAATENSSFICVFLCSAPDFTFLSVHLSVMSLCLRLHSLFPSSPDVSSEHLADADASCPLINKRDVPSCYDRFYSKPITGRTFFFAVVGFDSLTPPAQVLLMNSEDNSRFQVPLRGRTFTLKLFSQFDNRCSNFLHNFPPNSQTEKSIICNLTKQKIYS